MQTIEQRAVVFSLPLQSQSKSNFYLAAARLAPLNYRSSKRTPVLLICKQMKKGHKYIYMHTRTLLCGSSRHQPACGWPMLG